MGKIILNILALFIVIFVIIYQVNYAPRPHSYHARGLGLTSKGFALEAMIENKKELVRLDDFENKAVVLYFGFASCPDICPMALSTINSILQEVAQRDQVQVIFVSVDYKRDTSESTMKYAQFFNSDFIGLTGTKEQIEELAGDYKVHFKFIEMPGSKMEYTVDHTSRYYIFGKNNELLYAIHSNEPRETIKELVENAIKGE